MLSALIWVLLVVGVGVWAKNWGRSGLLFGILSFFLSPLVGALILIICGRTAESKAEQKAANSQPIQVIVNTTGGQPLVADQVQVIPVDTVPSEPKVLEEAPAEPVITQTVVQEQKKAEKVEKVQNKVQEHRQKKATRSRRSTKSANPRASKK